MKILPWMIEISDCGADSREFRESIFSLGNGYMGTRGFRPEEPGAHSAWRSTFISGFFEYIRPGITDMVNQPDFSAAEIRIAGRPVTELPLSDFRQRLYMDCGLAEWEYTAQAEGAAVRIKVEKFLSMAERHTAAIRFTLTPVKNSRLRNPGRRDPGNCKVSITFDFLQLFRSLLHTLVSVCIVNSQSMTEKFSQRSKKPVIAPIIIILYF